MSIDNFEDARKILAGFMPSKKKSKLPYALDNMKSLMTYLGNPQNKLKIIHIAGTSGKTSTAYFIASLLSLTGKKVGLTVSPHISEVNERVQINMVPLEEADFCRELALFLDLVDKSKLKPSYFELLIAFAYWEFEKQKVDYAVIEVGLGGLLDGTNVVSRPDKVCVITDIGFDHVAKLGSTLELIAAQKAGIIQERNETFCIKQSDEVMRVFEATCRKEHASIHVLEDVNTPEKLKFLPLFQQRNFLLGLFAFDFIKKRDDLELTSSAQVLVAAHIPIPGRMEIFKVEGKTLILDGAHNAQKLSALVDSVSEKFPDHKVAMLLSFSSHQSGVVDLIAKVADFVILTSFLSAVLQDEPKQPIDGRKLADELNAKGIETEINLNSKNALKTLLARPEPVLVVSGSFYLLNTIRPLILEL